MAENERGIKKVVGLIGVALAVILVTLFHVGFASAVEKEERSLDSGIKVVPSAETVWNAIKDRSVDSVLGAPFFRYTMYTDAGGGKSFHSTLVGFPHSGNARGIILYVHGYNDYFFQKELAEKADSAGYAFFAIDLHYCGRSLMPGDARGDMRNMREFFAELDYAVELARVITKERTDSLPMVLMGHSQGGLLAAFYADHRPEEKFAALVLNSPFFDFNFNWLVRNLAIPVVSEIAMYLPDFSIGSSGNPNYAYSLDKKYYGEWLYNTEWKSESRPEQFLGWVRAIHKAQQELHRGFHINSPTLVMHGDCTEKGEEWSENYMHCDGVLDVEHIEKWAPKVGPNVKTETIAGGLHDLFLSRKAVRDEAYAKAFRFIDESL
ncbi:MAG: alpha/beta hydrolase [Fibrobacter sp.]|nr:alpha/beta hydrolase [Fibrobacter sp.]